MPLSSGQINTAASNIVASVGSINPVSRSVPLTTPSARTPAFHSWIITPWTTDTNQDIAILRVKNTTYADATVEVIRSNVGGATQVKFYWNGSVQRTFYADTTSASTMNAIVTFINGMSGWVVSVLNGYGTSVAGYYLKNQSVTSCYNVNVDLKAGGTSTGDALLINPAFRFCPSCHIRWGAIDYSIAPGAPSISTSAVQTKEQIATRLYQWVYWQGWAKGKGSGLNNNYEGLHSIISFGHSQDQDSYVHGSPHDAIGSPTNSTLKSKYGPSMFYGPFNANATAINASWSTDLASILKAAMDLPVGSFPDGLCYPDGLLCDTEQHGFFLYNATKSLWSGNNGTWDGYSMSIGDNRYPGNIIYGDLAIQIQALTSTPVTIDVTDKTDGSGNYTGEINITVSGNTQTVSLNGTQTVAQVVTALAALSNNGGTFLPAAIGDDTVLCYPYKQGSKTISGFGTLWKIWNNRYKPGFYSGWLELLINDPTVADLDRRASEIIYEDWDGTQFVGKTFDSWWASMVSLGLDNFDPTKVVTANGGIAQNQRVAIVGRNYDMANSQFCVRLNGGPWSGWYSVDPSKLSAASLATSIGTDLGIPGGITGGTNTLAEYYWLERNNGVQQTWEMDVRNVTYGTVTLTELKKARSVQTWSSTNLADGTRQFNQTTGAFQTRTKQTQFTQEIQTFVWKMLDYRFWYGLGAPFKAVFPGLRVCTEYGVKGGASALKPVPEGDNDPNHATYEGVRRLHNAPHNYRAYTAESYGVLYYDKNWKTDASQTAMQATFNFIDQQQDSFINGHKPTLVWVNEPGDTLGWAGWKTTDAQLRRQCRTYIDNNKDFAAQNFDIVFYVDITSMGMPTTRPYRPTIGYDQTYTSDLFILNLINESVAYGATRPSLRGILRD